MTGFDYHRSADRRCRGVGGFMRGLRAGGAVARCVDPRRLRDPPLHTPLTLALQDHIGTDITTALLAFTLLLLIPYAAMKVIANNVGSVSRNSMLGPVDRVLGLVSARSRAR